MLFKIKIALIKKIELINTVLLLLLLLLNKRKINNFIFKNYQFVIIFQLYFHYILEFNKIENTTEERKNNNLFK